MTREGRLFQDPARPEGEFRIKKPYEDENSPEMAAAKAFWRKHLEGEERIQEPMHPECELAIVVPVFKEDPHRLLRQIDSIKRQTGINPARFEVHYVINNGEDDGSDAYIQTRAKNIHAIELLRQNHGINTHVIDKSSPGHAIPGCTAEKARNRGIAEAGVRFYEQDKNGILLQTDADCWLEDPTHLARLCDKMRTHPDAIAAAGGVMYEWDPDEQAPEAREGLRKKFETLLQLKQARRLTSFLNDHKFHPETRLSGAHMISRSLETAMVGGFRNLSRGADTEFGFDLQRFADTHQGELLNLRPELSLVTALRDSDRTLLSTKGLLEHIDDENQDTLIRDAFPAEDISAFRHTFYGQVATAFKARDEETMYALLRDRQGRSLVPETEVDCCMDELRAGRYKKFTELVKALNKAYVGKNTLLERLYAERYPPVPLSAAYLRRLREAALSRPGGPEFIREMDAHYGAIRVRSDM